MKKLPFLCVSACFVACNENNPDQNNPYANYVDLGLSSGILWSPVNEINSHDSSPYFSSDMTYYLDKKRMWVSSLMSGMPIRLVKKKNRHEAEGSIYEE